MAQNGSTTRNTDLGEHEGFVSKHFDSRRATIDMNLKMEQLQKGNTEAKR